MRQLLLFMIVFMTVPLSFAAPQVALLSWAWLSFMKTNTLAYMSFPIIYAAGIITAISWVISRERKRLPVNPLPVLVILFMCQMTVSSYFGLEQRTVWEFWSRNIKSVLLGLFVMAVMVNRVRLHALAWVIVISLGFYSVKGGLFTIVTGGGGQVLAIAGVDNNISAVEMLTAWPLMNYLRLQSGSRLVRGALAVMMGLTPIAVMGTYSRGGLIALAVTLGYFWWKSKRKVMIAICGAAVLIPSIQMMPDRWAQKMNTISKYEEVGTAQERLRTWNMSFAIALDRPFVGVGMEGILSPAVNDRYDPGRDRLEAHSIWFQTMSDHGFVGFLLFVAIAAMAWQSGNSVRRRARARPEFAWASDLATMCQLCMAGFFLGGSFVSVAYYDVYWSIVAIMAVLREIVPKPVTSVIAVRPPIAQGGPQPVGSLPS